MLKIIITFYLCLTFLFINTSLVNASDIVANCPRFHFELNNCADCEQKNDIDSILAIGNSITWRTEQADIGWLNNWGMAASNEDRDWVHLLKSSISKDQATDVDLYIWKTIDLNFLSNKSLHEMETEWGEIQKRKPDYGAIFIQIGGNALNTEVDNFEKPYKKLLDFLKEKTTAKIFLLSTWSFSNNYPNANKIIQSLAEKYSAAYVDISFLSEHPDFTAKNEPICMDASVADNVCLHPGDKGMEAIAFEVCHQNHATKFNELNGELTFEDILVDSVHFSARLKYEGDLTFQLMEHKVLENQDSDSHSAAFHLPSNAVISPKAQAFKTFYDIELKQLSGDSKIKFNLERADKTKD